MPNRLDGGHSDRLRAFGSLADLELNSLILIEGAEPVPLYLGVVDKYILCAAVRGDKPETLLAVEPFNSSLCHANYLSLSVVVTLFNHDKP